MNENIKRLLERLWLDWEPVTLRGELLNGGDQQLTLTIRRKHADGYQVGCNCWDCVQQTLGTKATIRRKGTR